MRLLSRIHPRSHVTRRGAAAIELALVFPLFFGFMYACFEYGRYMMLYNTANNAAYEAARVAMSHGATAQQGEDAADSMLAIFGVTGTSVNIHPSTITNETEEVRVRIRIPWTSANSYLPPLFADDDITAECTLACEGYRTTNQPADLDPDDLSDDPDHVLGTEMETETEMEMEMAEAYTPC